MRRLWAALWLVLLAGIVQAEEPMIDRFEAGAETRWRFFTDQVMGGVSTGRVTLMSEADRRFARMTGEVSTRNRGGFIQMRRELARGDGREATGVRLLVRGNGERYFVHLRTRGTRLPWQYYQAGFEAGEDWSEVRLPLTAFRASGALMTPEPRAEGLTSVAVVAYGRAHEVEIDVAEVGLY